MMHECTDWYQNAAGIEDGAKLIVCSLQLPCSQNTAASQRRGCLSSLSNKSVDSTTKRRFNDYPLVNQHSY